MDFGLNKTSLRGTDETDECKPHWGETMIVKNGPKIEVNLKIYEHKCSSLS